MTQSTWRHNIAMKCQLCGKDFRALGVHLRHKHKVDPDDYREEFGLLRATPLCDPYISKALQKVMLLRLESDGYKEEVTARCKANVDISRRTYSGMTSAGKVRLAQRNTDRNTLYLQEKSQAVKKILLEKKSITDVRMELGMSASAVRKIIAMEGIDYNQEEVSAIKAGMRSAAALRRRLSPEEQRETQ